MSKPSPPSPPPAQEEDPWWGQLDKDSQDSIQQSVKESAQQVERSEAARPSTGVSLSTSTSALPNDGRITYSCLYPVLAGSVLGAPLGAVFNAVGKQPWKVGAVQGAAFFATNAGVTCWLVKARNGSMYDRSYNRAVSFGVAGMMWPISGELYRIATKQPALMPVVAFQRALTVGAGAGMLGFIMDYFDLGRPMPPQVETKSPEQPQ